jgi:hypothetical protein
MEQRRQGFLAQGDPAPWFTCSTRANKGYAFQTVAGRYVLLSFLGPGSSAEAAAFLEGIWSERRRFDDQQLTFFGVCTSPDYDRSALRDAIPGIRFFWDLDRSVSVQFGGDAPDGGERPVSYVLDPTLRVIAVVPGSGAEHWRAVKAALDRLPPLSKPEPVAANAPVLVLPRVFEPEFCRELIGYYEKQGGNDSGFMREVGGMTTGIIDYGVKRRRDCGIVEETLRNACVVRIRRRLLPEIEKAFQYRATRMERYTISCYDAAEGGYFQAHRDNGAKGTAHRRFAVSLFLNSGDYEGGYLRFPEFSTALYSAPVGGAVVFGCSLLHEATPVTRGKRYMFLPFLYDDQAARIRKANRQYLDPTPPPPAKGAQGRSD